MRQKVRMRMPTRKQFSNSFLLLALAVALIGIGIAWQQYRANKAADNRAAQAQQVANHGHATGNTPSTVKPSSSAFDSYRVPVDHPRYLFIPKLSVRAMVKPLGLTKDNRLAAPDNVFDAGWYAGSSLPGNPGAVVIDGHVSSWTAHGIFYGLKDLKPGDAMQVERGDGKIFTYKVVRSQSYSADSVDMNAVLAPVDPGKPGLNLITCDGSVIKGTNEFNKRIVVFTVQM